MQPSRTSITLRSEALVVLAYGVMAVILTWPLVLHMGTHVVGRASFPDYIGHLWHSRWFAAALFDGVSPYQVHTVLYPAGSTDLVIKSGPCLNAAATAPFQLLFNAVASYNFTVIGLMMLTAYGGYRLTLDLTRDRASSFAAGAVLTMNPMMYSEMSAGHMDQFSGGWCLLTLMYVLRTVKGRGRWAPILAALFFALSTLSYLGFGLLMGGLVPLLVLWFVATKRSLLTRALLIRLAAFAVTVAVLLSPVVLAYVTQEGTGEASGATGVTFPLTGAPERLDSLPITERIIVTESIQPFDLGLTYETGRRGLLPQLHLVVLALVIAGATLRWRRSLPWVLGALLFCVLALGPYLRGNGDPHATSALAPLPGLVLYNHAPFFTRFRFPYRFMFMVWVCLVPVVGLGVRALLGKAGLPKRLRIVPAAGLCLLLFIESTARGMMPFPAPLEQFPHTPRFYTEVLAEEPGGAILNIPFALRKPTMEEERAFPVPYWQALEMHHHGSHRQAILTGIWVAFSPPAIHGRFVRENTLLSNVQRWQQDGPATPVELADVWVMQELGFRHAVVTEPWLRPRTAATIRGHLTQLFGPPHREPGDGLLVFRLDQEGPLREGLDRYATVDLGSTTADPRHDPALVPALDHVRAHADDLQARLELVDRCEERGDFGLALELLDGAGDTAGVHHRRGRLYQARGIPALALDEYERARALDPSLSIDTSELDLPAVRRR